LIRFRVYFERKKYNRVPTDWGLISIDGVGFPNMGLDLD
jgi:hypothetical protein